MSDDTPRLQKTVLVIACADSPVLNAVAEVLSTWKLECAEDNKDALALIEKTAFDLVITDQASSARDDVELLRKIRRVRPHARVIIVAETSTPADVIAAMRAQAFSYFTKPLSAPAMEEVLQLAMESPAWDEAIEVLSGTDAWIRLSLRCDVSTANRLHQFVREFLLLPRDDEEKVATACREMLLNAMEHGGKFNPERRIEIAFLRARHVVLIRIKDPGEGFSLKDNLDTAMNNPPDDPMRHLKHRSEEGMRPGGYGILVAKNLVDEMFYGEKGNDVLLIKYIHDERKASPSPA
ncbi:ATP-binding protein [Alloacidobacterium dinghuense]|uniref:ATP-binding protein n=1 Tax=Alloacidobacterium dinghuense TaxID=2763107 RepID=A0A7G8BG41_9BACT|nr:ATP-binding protein [Alloacidobacterium dinghuense]QNI31511.1 ATP-binding protein [Alloacidobacterium dinghuense]